jgi:hypothetical protein
MHEGDTSLDGLDETGTSEKSVVCDIRGTSESDLRITTYMRMKGNQTTRYQGRGSSQRSRTVGDCSHPLIQTIGE